MIKMELLQKYSTLSTQALAVFKSAKEKAILREQQYGVPSAEAIDIAKTQLAETKRELHADYQTELSTAISGAKQSVVSATSTSSIEMKNVEGFIQSIKTELAIGNTSSAVEMMQTYSDNLTDKQKSGAFAMLANDLSVAGVEKSLLRELSDQYSNDDATALRQKVSDLNEIRYDNPTLEIDSYELAQRVSGRPIGNLTGDVKPLYQPDAE